MARLTRSQLAMMAGFEILPPTLMVLRNYPVWGAATLGAVLAASALQSWIVVRSEQDRHRAILSYAQDTTTMGGDPSSVIAALQGSGGSSEDGAAAQLVLGHYDPRGYRGDQLPAAVWSQRYPRR
ncbi:MAG: hypothetical protein ACRDSP_06950 [Pseudonocardiaceae bacterium]